MITLKYQFVVIILSNNSDDVCDVMYDVVCNVCSVVMLCVVMMFGDGVWR